MLYLFSGWEDLLTQTEHSVMTLSTMLMSPHVTEFRQEVEYWVQLLQELGTVRESRVWCVSMVAKQHLSSVCLFPVCCESHRGAARFVGEVSAEMGLPEQNVS